MTHLPSSLLTLPGRVISLVGGGGKTTLLYALAEAYARLGKRVLIAATTKIYHPHPDYFASSVPEVQALWQKGAFAVIGTSLGEKITFPPQSLWDALFPLADVILLEADGAKHHPIKVPRAGEPVILPECDTVFAVMGLSAIGTPLQQCCFGMDGFPNPAPRLLTEADAAQILHADWGSRKQVGSRAYCVILNQCDTPQRLASAEQIACLLKENGVSQVVFTSFSEEERTHYQTISQRNTDI